MEIPNGLRPAANGYQLSNLGFTPTGKDLLTIWER